jgi:hypothetical protein
LCVNPWGVKPDLRMRLKPVRGAASERAYGAA